MINGDFIRRIPSGYVNIAMENGDLTTINGDLNGGLMVIQWDLPSGNLTVCY